MFKVRQVLVMINNCAVLAAICGKCAETAMDTAMVRMVSTLPSTPNLIKVQKLCIYTSDLSK